MLENGLVLGMSISNMGTRYATTIYQQEVGSMDEQLVLKIVDIVFWAVIGVSVIWVCAFLYVLFIKKYDEEPE